ARSRHLREHRVSRNLVMKLRSLHWISVPFVAGLVCHCGDGGRYDAPAALEGADPSSSPVATPPGNPDAPSAMPSAAPDGMSSPGGEGGPTPVGNVVAMQPTPEPNGTSEPAPVEPVPPLPRPAFDGSFILGADISSPPETTERKS